MTEDPLLSQPTSLLIIGAINATLAILGIVVTYKQPHFGAIEVMAISINLIMAAACFWGAYSRWRQTCRPG